MGGDGKKDDSPNKDDGKPGKPHSPPIENNDFEDGDIATPKRDRGDEDNRPL
jgi:hypothetical protein